MSTNISDPVKITFNKAGGPITFQMQGDYDTSGECCLMYRKQGTAGYVPNSGGHLALDGNKPANATIGTDPVTAPNGLDPAQLFRVRTSASYDPAQNGSIVKVTYRFFQKEGQWLPPGEIVLRQDNVTRPPVDDERVFEFVGV
jgi:hypothetical protein